MCVREYGVPTKATAGPRTLDIFTEPSLVCMPCSSAVPIYRAGRCGAGAGGWCGSGDGSEGDGGVTVNPLPVVAAGAAARRDVVRTGAVTAADPVRGLVPLLRCVWLRRH